MQNQQNLLLPNKNILTNSQQSNQFIPIITTQHKLFNHYSSSQHYFYSNKINQIIKQKCVHSNIYFEDIQCLLDQQEYLKRQYYQDQYTRKLGTFKQYYFYHEDCPRIFGDLGIAQAYQKWQQRKRDYIYKKLKFMYNQSYTSANSSQNTIQEIDNNLVHVTHFLLDISEYNPYSKKYYLRVQARQQKQKQQKQRKQQQKQKQKQKQRRKQRQNNQSITLYSKINKQLSRMLTNIQDQLSILTVMDVMDSEQSNTKLSPNSKRRIIKINEINNKKPIKLNFNKKQLIFLHPQKQNQYHQKQTNDNQQIRIQSKTHNYVIIDTDSSIDKKQALKLHKKHISDIGKNQYQLNNNIYNSNNNNIAMTTNLTNSKNLQIPDNNKIKSIMLMSSFGLNKNNQFPTNVNGNSNGKTKLIKFGDQQYKHKIQVLQSRNGEIRNNIKIRNLQSYVPIQNNGLIKSYKSLQKLDRYNNPSSQLQSQNSSGSKRSYSLSKLQTPIKQHNTIESLTKLIDNKLSQKQKSIKKSNLETVKQNKNMEQFNDRKILSKGLISYKSQKFQSSTSTSINLRNNSIKGSLHVKFQDGRISNGKLKIDGNNINAYSQEKYNRSQMKNNNIRISLKNGINNGKVINNKINK